MSEGRGMAQVAQAWARRHWPRLLLTCLVLGLAYFLMEWTKPPRIVPSKFKPWQAYVDINATRRYAMGHKDRERLAAVMAEAAGTESAAAFFGAGADAIGGGAIAADPPPPAPLRQRLQPAMPRAAEGTLVIYLCHYVPPPEEEADIDAAARTTRSAGNSTTGAGTGMSYGMGEGASLADELDAVTERAQHAANLALFARLALQQGDGTTTRLVVAHGARRTLDSPELALPRSADWVELAPGACLEGTWGMLGAALPLLPDQSTFKYFVVVDSSVAGPFVPPAFRPRLHWTRAFVDRLQGNVSMVGGMISCEPAAKDGDLSANDGRDAPHVLRAAWAVDAEGWSLLISRAANITGCHARGWDEAWHGDKAAAQALLGAGRALDCLMLRYQGVDWRDRKNWACNDRLPPDRQNLYDGTTVGPYEVMFWPIHPAQADNYGALRAGVKYANWSMGSPTVDENEYFGRPGAPLPVVELEWSVRGEVAVPLRTLHGGDGCFDHTAYARDPAMGALRESCFMGTCGFSMFDHYLLVGLFQARRAGWVCPAPALSDAQRTALVLAQGRACFDAEHYRGIVGVDAVPADAGPRALWEHYARRGQFEGKAARWLCGAAAPSPIRGPDGTPGGTLGAEAWALVAGLDPEARGLTASQAKPVGAGGS